MERRAPRVLLCDNLRNVVLERHGDAIRFHPTLLSFAGHYRYEPRPVAIARGNDERRVVPNRPRKSVGSETTFMQDLAQPAEIEEGIASVLEDVWSYCQRTGAAGPA